MTTLAACRENSLCWVSAIICFAFLGNLKQDFPLSQQLFAKKEPKCICRGSLDGRQECLTIKIPAYYSFQSLTNYSPWLISNTRNKSCCVTNTVLGGGLGNNWMVTILTPIVLSSAYPTEPHTWFHCSWFQGQKR